MAQEKEILSEKCINGFMEMVETQAVEIDDLEEENEVLKMQIHDLKEEMAKQYYGIQQTELKAEKAKSDAKEKESQIAKLDSEIVVLRSRIIWSGRIRGIIIVESMIMMVVILCFARWWLPLLQVMFYLVCMVIERFFYQSSLSGGCP